MYTRARRANRRTGQVILTYRDKEAWLKSCNGSIMQVFRPFYGFATWWIPEVSLHARP